MAYKLRPILNKGDYPPTVVLTIYDEGIFRDILLIIGFWALRIEPISIGGNFIQFKTDSLLYVRNNIMVYCRIVISLYNLSLTTFKRTFSMWLSN